MNNSEILYIYDAKLCNPNGDPDEENRPRMDAEREINLVSDLRLKRYIRDYLYDMGYDIFVRKVNDVPVTAKKRVEVDGKEFNPEKLIDVRLFGATIPVKDDTQTFIGPVQFNWGYSLNKIELLEASITSHFATDEKAKQGTIGKDYRVKYSLIAFFGVISGKRANRTKLTNDDIKLLDKAMKEAIPLQATRSKIGQYPRLYIRVEYNDDKTVLGDFRDYIKIIEHEENIRDINEIKLDITELIKLLDDNRSKIKEIKYFTDDNLNLQKDGIDTTFEQAFANHNLFVVD